MSLLICLALAVQAPNVHLVTDEAESVLRILSAEQKGDTVTEADWSQLFATDGYQRLKQREQGMKRKFEDAEFKAFVQSKDLIARRDDLAKALTEWSQADMGACGKTALAYLPKGADIKAKIYILIKPLHNSFVWQSETDPAIMLYLEPGKSHESFANTVSHEMHHIGYSRSCPSREFTAWLEKQSQAKNTAYMWLGGFGEGDAVLAAAGGLGVDPQATAAEDVRQAWRDGMAHQPEQFKQVEGFFLKVCSGELKSDKVRDKAMEFFGIVGPWYTVGYTVATTIEKVDGRDKLIACFLDPRLLLPTYNAAAKKLDAGLPLWSDEFLAAMK
jgi:hypothetical protein